MARETTDLIVLDTIADDLESLEIILRRVNHPEFGWTEFHNGLPFSREDIVPAVLRLLHDQLAEAYRQEIGGLVKVGLGIIPEGDLDDYWFGIAPHGLMIHAAWEP